jgi:hypothetical protein
MTSEAKRTQYTLEFKLEAVRLVKAGHTHQPFGRREIENSLSS